MPNMLDFSWFQQGTNTVVDHFGQLTMTSPLQGSSTLRGLFASAPTAPYSVVARMSAWSINDGTSGAAPVFGVGFLESGTSDAVTITCSAHTTASARIGVYRWDAGTFSAAPLAVRNNFTFGPALWFKFEDDNTDLNFSVSTDGRNWIEIYTESRTAFLTSGPDNIGWFVADWAGDYGCIGTLHDWLITA